MRMLFVLIQLVNLILTSGDLKTKKEEETKKDIFINKNVSNVVELKIIEGEKSLKKKNKGSQCCIIF